MAKLCQNLRTERTSILNLHDLLLDEKLWLFPKKFIQAFQYLLQTDSSEISPVDALP